tara:strand:- start:337 stop:504 length:168 start_codon:yes stop_codon:yes gene_type:complete
MAGLSQKDREIIAAYRAAQAARSPEQLAEERFEQLAAFGPGVKLINVITGEETTT